jgi:hypothetical protein
LVGLRLGLRAEVRERSLLRSNPALSSTAASSATDVPVLPPALAWRAIARAAPIMEVSE